MGMKGRVRIYEVAEHVGVSPTTVSAAITGKRPVAEATRQRIEQAIEELGYRANANARALAYGSSGTIALLIPSLEKSLSQIELEFVASVAEAARSRGYDVLVSFSGDDELALSRLIDERRADGIVLLEVFLDDFRVERLQALGFPFVAIGRTAKPSGIDWVDIDFARLQWSLVNGLAELGHQRIALISGPYDLLKRRYAPQHRTHRAFKSACAKLGVHGDILYCERNADAGLRRTAELLANDKTLTGLVVVNELALPGVYRAVAKAGLRMPEDVSVIGQCDSKLPTYLVPRLTAAQFPSIEMGRAAVEILTDRLADRSLAPRGRLILPTIVAGESTGRARATGLSERQSPEVQRNRKKGYTQR
jgi:DNA-binding LacI/PurR family transcriptional regulator